MTATTDPVVLREALRQGERMLAFQSEVLETTRQRVGDLLRLTIATLGGVIVMGGILANAHVRVDGLAGGVLGVGVVMIVIAGTVLTRLVGGAGHLTAFAYGPALDRLVAELQRAEVGESALLGSVVWNLPVWIDPNERSIEDTKGRTQTTVRILIPGVFLVVAALFYIVTGEILG